MSKKKISKDSTFEEKVAFLREHLLDENTDNSLAIRNILCLINSQTLTDDLFENNDILFKDIEEFSDIKTELHEDIRGVKRNISIAYLSIITSCRAITAATEENIKNVPNLYKVAIGNLGFFTLNSFLNKHLSDITKDDLYVVQDAVQLCGVLLAPLAALNNVVGEVFKEK